MKYKKGDKVRVLGADSWCSEARAYVGYAAIVDAADEKGEVFMIYMCKEKNRHWSIKDNSEIELFIKAGEQMEFSFMEDK